jgi:site-specific recombinase XerD
LLKNTRTLEWGFEAKPMVGEGLAKPTKDVPLAGLVEQFLAGCEKTVTPETASWYRVFLEDFAERYPKVKPQDIAPWYVRAWSHAEQKRTWGQSTHRSAVIILKQLLNWAVENRILAQNPIKDFERTAATRRKCVLTSEERAEVLSWYPQLD